MDLYRSFSGAMEIRILCADPAGGITYLEENGVELRNIQLLDELTFTAQIQRKQRNLVAKLCRKKGLDVTFSGRMGIYWRLNALWHRPVLLLTLLGMLILGMYVPSRIFFIRVEGNASIPSRLILETAAECGIEFGASRKDVRSEKTKNSLLEAMPQLQWAGVNTKGCVAVISVRERQTPAVDYSNKGVGSIIAARDGVITELTATKGNPVCKVGQAVKAGQILISGYTDCGIAIRADCASGEVFGETQREMTLIYPLDREQRGQILCQETKYSLIIGKNRINFYFGSGISGSTCVKMYEENYLTLPGGFQLPVVLVKETIVQYETENGTIQANEAWVEKYAGDYLLGQMVAGRILSAETEIVYIEHSIVFRGRYACYEMIGQFHKEEIIKPDGTND